MTEPGPVLVAGAGSWGTALAITLAANGHPTRLWGRDPAQMQALASARANEAYLPGIRFPDSLQLSADLHAALADAALLLLAVPAASLRDVLTLAARARPEGLPLAWASKGFEPSTRLLAHEVVAEVFGNISGAVISGPTFAREVAAGLPGAIVVASTDAALAERVAALLRNRRFRAYTSDDVVGVELGGAIKNVLAIAAGVSDGLGYGSNCRAALITRGLAEMTRLGTALGGRRETFMGLAGLGDLVLTCTDSQSRNHRFGLLLAEGEAPEAAARRIGQVVEGMRTAAEVCSLAQREGVEMPIVYQVHRVIQGECSPLEAVQALLARDPKPE